jgi:hypothetical protein
MLFCRARHRMRCRNATRGKAVLDVAVHLDRRGPAVVLHLNDAAVLFLTPLQVGWLRGRLRAAAYEAAELAAAISEQAERNKGWA